MLDARKNFAKADLAAGIASGATSLGLVSGGGARFPSPPFNAVLWDSADYGDPSDDPNVEIVRVTFIAGDTLTILRGQESTSDVSHNTAGAYTLVAGPTAKLVDDLVAVAGEEMTYAKRIDFITDDEFYKGEAAVGSVESAAVWRIRKTTVAGDGDVTEVWADGTDAFSKQWSQRLTYTYS